MSRVISNIVLIGMPGCGKTTIGKILSQKLKREFIDIDSYIEKSENTTISEIFNKGEEHFRNIEARAVKNISNKNGAIISTGGGVVKRVENINLLKQNGIIFFIDRPIESIVGDIDVGSRPLLNKNKGALYDLYKERYDLYKNYCDFVINNDKSIEIAVEKILGLI